LHSPPTHHRLYQALQASADQLNHPWTGDFSQAGGGIDWTPKEVIALWEAFALSFAKQGINPPQHIITEQMIVNTRAKSEDKS
jgi:hypothetical protein